MQETGLPRIYWLTEEFFPPQVGGAELMASYLTQGLAARDFATEVVTRQTDPVSAADERLGRVRVRRLRPGGQTKGTGWRAFPAIAGYLWRLALLLVRERERYDILVICGMKIIPLVAVPVARMLGKRCVIRVESSFELREPISAESLGTMPSLGRALGRTLQRLQRALVRRADRVVAISAEIEELLRASGLPGAQIARIPNAVDLSRFTPVSREAQRLLRLRLGIPTGRTIVLYAGRLSRAKGIAMLIDAWPQLIAAHPDLFLVIVGGGSESFDNCHDYVAERVQGLRAHACMVGPSDRVQEYLQAADLFVFPSEYEGFSLGLIEALASALPVVVTAVGAAPQLIRDGNDGFLFAPKDERALVQALGTALASREHWADIGRRARESVTAFDLPTVVGQYATLCRALE